MFLRIVHLFLCSISSKNQSHLFFSKLSTSSTNFLSELSHREPARSLNHPLSTPKSRPFLSLLRSSNRIKKRGKNNGRESSPKRTTQTTSSKVTTRWSVGRKRTSQKPKSTITAASDPLMLLTLIFQYFWQDSMGYHSNGGSKSLRAEKGVR